jgi:flagellar biosynthesis anti-sigma factor FlgM
MKIDLTRTPDTPDSGATRAASKQSENARTNLGMDQDTAKLSSGQATVAALAAQVNEAPEIRQDKVSALAELVRSGNYRVTPEQTADALVAHMTLAPAA